MLLVCRCVQLYPLLCFRTSGNYMGSYRHMPVDIHWSRVFVALAERQWLFQFSLHWEKALMPSRKNVRIFHSQSICLMLYYSSGTLAFHWQVMYKTTSESLYFEVSKFKWIILHMKALFHACLDFSTFAQSKQFVYRENIFSAWFFYIDVFLLPCKNAHVFLSKMSLVCLSTLNKY